MEQQLTNIALILGMIMGASSFGVVLFVFARNQAYGLGGISLTLFGVILLGLSLWKTIEVSVAPDGGFQAKFQAFEKEIRNELVATSDRIDAVTQLATMTEDVDMKIASGKVEVLVELDQGILKQGSVCVGSPIENREVLLLSVDSQGKRQYL